MFSKREKQPTHEDLSKYNTRRADAEEYLKTLQSSVNDKLLDKSVYDMILTKDDIINIPKAFSEWYATISDFNTQDYIDNWVKYNDIIEAVIPHMVLVACNVTLGNYERLATLNEMVNDISDDYSIISIPKIYYRKAYKNFASYEDNSGEYSTINVGEIPDSVLPEIKMSYNDFLNTEDSISKIIDNPIKMKISVYTSLSLKGYDYGKWYVDMTNVTSKLNYNIMRSYNLAKRYFQSLMYMKIFLENK